jgi:hypothetical protein
MPSTTKVPLGASTLNRKWYLDVNTNTHAAPTWVGVFGVEDLTPALDPSVQPDDDYDSNGWKASTITALGWTLGIKLARKVTTALATAYDPGQEVLRAAAQLMGASNRVEVRWYEMNSGGPKVEAYQGYAAVSWTDDGGSMEANSTVTVTLTGQGSRDVITHPDGAAVVPVLYSVSPAVGIQAGGTLHRLVGAGFFAAGVANVLSMKLGVTNVPTFLAESNNVLHFVAPAKAAGPFVIYVTNTVGESTTVTVTLTIT